MQKIHFLMLKKLKISESAQLCSENFVVFFSKVHAQAGASPVPQGRLQRQAGRERSGQAAQEEGCKFRIEGGQSRGGVFKDYFRRHSDLRRHENRFLCRLQP